MIKNFVEIALCSTVFEILAFLCFAIFAQKFENSKWPPFLARQNFFENWHGYSAEIPCGSKISSKSLYLARFSRYKHFCGEGSRTCCAATTGPRYSTVKGLRGREGPNVMRFNLDQIQGLLVCLFITK